jgi:PadR family transcriptional regulator PadR
MADNELGLLQGTLDVLVLKALSAQSRHGYAVAQWIRSTTENTLQIEDGALYTALHRMEKRGWLTSTWGQSENNRKAKYYKITAAGRKHLKARSKTWSKYADAVSKILKST